MTDKKASDTRGYGHESAVIGASAVVQGEAIRPTYYVRHPDGTLSIAKPQPTVEEIAAQKEFVYAQCDRKHSGSCCEDPNCHLNRIGD